MPRVYLSGPMTGLPDLNFPAFGAAAELLRDAGFQVTNPAEINPDQQLPWEQCMRADIKALCDCDTLALLPGWERSRGAQLELQVAHRLGLEITTVERLLAVQHVARPLDPARPIDMQQVLYALERARITLLAQANVLHEQRDYGAEFPWEDAQRMAEASLLITALATRPEQTT